MSWHGGGKIQVAGVQPLCPAQARWQVEWSGMHQVKPFYMLCTCVLCVSLCLIYLFKKALNCNKVFNLLFI